MALIAERWGLIPELRSYAKGGHPIWGTCAGLIFLADRASGAPAPIALSHPLWHVIRPKSSLQTPLNSGTGRLTVAQASFHVI